MSERSNSPCSDRHFPPKAKKIHKKHEDSDRISESGQSKLTHFFKNIQKPSASKPNNIDIQLIHMEQQLELLRDRISSMEEERSSIIVNDIEKKKQHEIWMKKSRELIQQNITEIYANIREKKGQIDKEKGYYDVNSGRFVKGQYGIKHEENKKKYEQMLQNKQYENEEEMKMLQQFIFIQDEQIKRCRKELNAYRQRLKNAQQQKNCKFSNSWNLVYCNKYQILQLLGKGGFSQVYKAYNLEQNKYVAIKRSSLRELKTNITHYIVQEYENHIKLNHPNIAKMYEVVQASQTNVSIAIQYCQGPELSEYLKQFSGIPQKKARDIIRQIFSALDYMCKLDNKIIHYDLKPQNIMFHNGRVKILDFGLSKQMDNQNSRMALSNMGMGTYWYLPPESFHEKNPSINEKVDIWSAGVILFEMLFNRKPFGHNKSQNSIINQGIMLSANKVYFPDEIQVSQNAKSLIRHCLQYDPKKRYTSSQALEHPFFTEQ